MVRERSIVVMISRGLCHFSAITILCSIQSMIFMAGKAIKTSITTEKTSVITISVIFISHNSDEQNLSLLWSEGGVMRVGNYYCLR